MAIATVQGLRRFFRSLERKIHDIHLFSACFKSVRSFLQKCFNFRRSSRSAHRRVKERTFETHIFAKFPSFSRISRLPQDSPLWSKIKKMCLNLTDRMIVASDPVGPGRPRENSFSKIFTLKMISRSPDDRQVVNFSFFSLPLTNPTSDKNFRALSQFSNFQDFS